jgi:hypothetical protein
VRSELQNVNIIVGSGKQKQIYMFIRSFLLFICVTPWIVWSTQSTNSLVVKPRPGPLHACPTWMSTDGHVNDMALLCEAVSWSSFTATGQCGTYYTVYQKDGKYDTRMRIYTPVESTNTVYIVFRPTQQNFEGQAIHDNREMVFCEFLPNCTMRGYVHKRFQEAFLSLTASIPAYLINGKTVYVGGHSLGGSLQLFMGLYLFYTHNIVPVLTLGLAGPFIGDEQFAMTYYSAYRSATKGTWWHVETEDKQNCQVHDGTVEGYQIENKSHQIFIDAENVCTFPIHPLKIPEDSYGMHDLNQYRLFTKGRTCHF